jgi:hypothetical protein
MSYLDDRLDLAEKKIKEPRFRENRGLSNEVGYYIFDYPAEEELYVRERIKYIQKRNENSGDEYRIVVFDLYDIMVEILKNKKYLDKCYSIEQKKGFQKVSNAVANFLKVNSTDGMIVNYIKEHTPDKAIIFITGIGKCYPIIRSHTVLNNLNLVIDKVPVVLFYPGKFDGQELVLFNEIKDDNYYRAFRLDE